MWQRTTAHVASVPLRNDTSFSSRLAPAPNDEPSRIRSKRRTSSYQVQSALVRRVKSRPARSPLLASTGLLARRRWSPRQLYTSSPPFTTSLRNPHPFTAAPPLATDQFDPNQTPHDNRRPPWCESGWPSSCSGYGTGGGGGGGGAPSGVTSSGSPASMVRRSASPATTTI